MVANNLVPAVSVAIPAYNAARYLAEAIDSVLAQTFTDLEIVVVDDGSTDDTPEVLQQYKPPVRWIRQLNLGLSGARNRGVLESRAPLVAFLDADDVWVPTKLEQQVRELSGRPEFGVAYSAFIEGSADLKPIGVTSRGRTGVILPDLLTRGNIVGTPSTVVCRRFLFDQRGGFDPRLSQCHDWDMWIRLATVAKFLYLTEPLIIHRRHETNMSRDP